MDAVRAGEATMDGDDGDPGDAGDPGWGPAMRASARTVIPGLILVLRHRTLRGADGLTALRAVFVNFALALVLITFVAWYTTGGDGPADLSGTVGGLIVGAVGVAAAVLVRFLPRPLDCGSDAGLADSYRTRFFLRLAFAESAALTGFAVSFPTGNPVMYLIGLAFTAAGFALLAPTAARLAADQRKLDARGCGRSLVRALRSGPLPGAPGPPR